MFSNLLSFKLIDFDRFVSITWKYCFLNIVAVSFHFAYHQANIYLGFFNNMNHQDNKNWLNFPIAVLITEPPVNPNVPR